MDNLSRDHAPNTCAATECGARTRDRSGHVARCRAALYCVLARTLSRPDDMLCAAICDGSLLLGVQEALAGAPPSHRDCLLLEWGLDLTSRDSLEAYGGAMAVEYTRLFSSGLLCPHYEADFVARDSFRSMHVIADVTNMYAIFGVKVAAGAAERPDHIAVELDFMHWLASKEAHAARQRQGGNIRLCRRAQGAFFERHLGRWGRAVARALRESTNVAFYRAVSQILERLLVAEATYLRMDLSAIEGGAVSLEDAAITNDTAKGACGGCSTCRG